MRELCIQMDAVARLDIYYVPEKGLPAFLVIPMVKSVKFMNKPTVGVGHVS